MTSNSNIFSFKNLSLCIYIGNTTLIDDTILLDYCSSFGTIASSFFKKEKFCDFHIIEYKSQEQLDKFLNKKIHEINQIILDVKLYKHILIHNDILNIHRKFYIGPILNSNDEYIIIQFYKTIDSTLKYCFLKQDNKKYLLFEFSNQQSITRIFEKQTIPISVDNRQFFIYRPFHPKQFVNKIISMNNKQNQIHIYGLNERITDQILIDYFHKRAPVLACHILSNNSKIAILEFNDKKTVRKILETPNIYLCGTNLSLMKASHTLISLLSPTDNSNERDDDDDDNEVRPSPSIPIFSSFQIPFYQENLQQQLQSFVNLTPYYTVSEPISIPPPETNGSGWSSPPRTVFTQSCSIDQPVSQSSSDLCATTNTIHTDSINRLTTMDLDIKPIQKPSSNNLSHFVEEIQLKLDQIKDEYRLKFEKDQQYIRQEINLLINEERQTFDKLNRYLTDNRKHHNNKRKSSPS